MIKILKRSDKERGIRITIPNSELGEGHIKKADHNLIVMTDLQKLGHEDWVAIAAYYAMYHSALAALASIGYKSDNHTATITALEVFFVKKNLLEKKFLEKFKQARDFEEEYVQKLRHARRQR